MTYVWLAVAVVLGIVTLAAWSRLRFYRDVVRYSRHDWFDIIFREPKDEDLELALWEGLRKEATLLAHRLGVINRELDNPSLRISQAWLRKFARDEFDDNDLRDGGESLQCAASLLNAWGAASKTAKPAGSLWAEEVVAWWSVFNRYNRPR